MEFVDICDSLHDASLIFMKANPDSLELRFTDFDSNSLENFRDFLFSDVSEFNISSLQEFELLKNFNDSEILRVTYAKNSDGRQSIRVEMELFDYEYKIREFLTLSFEFSIAIDVTLNLSPDYLT